MAHEEGKLRVLLAKSQIDGHDKGIRYVASKLREGGLEIIFINYGDVHAVVRTALQEDVDAICLSFLSGGHMYDVTEIIKDLSNNGINYLPVIVGGFIPPNDAVKLLNIGVKKYYGPGEDLGDIAEYIASELRKVKQ